MSSPVPFLHALTPRTLLQMAIRITGVMAVVTALSYWHIIDALTAQTRGNLQTYVVERAARESLFFRQAEEDQAVFRRVFLENWKAMGDVSEAEFRAAFETRADGTTRLRRQAFDGIAGPDGILSDSVTAFVGPQVAVESQDVRRRLMLMWRLVGRYGPAWTNRFTNLYAFPPENFLVGYWPGLAWGLEAEASMDMSGEIWKTITTPGNNPGRGSVWTPPYYDGVAGKWEITCVTPIDDGTRHLANVANDLVLNALFERVSSDRLAGTYNLIFAEDGSLVMHPSKLEELRQAGKSLHIPDSHDAGLSSLYGRVMEAARRDGAEALVVEDPVNDAFLGAVRLRGPKWWFVTVYPKHLLKSTAKSTAESILALSVLALAVELFMLYRVLRYKVVLPLRLFSRASLAVERGDYAEVASGHLGLPEQRRDEVGLLARSFRMMTRQVEESRQTLLRYNETLERQVAEKTASLEKIIMQLAASQAQTEMARQELTVKNREVEAASRAKSEFLATMSHEIRTPMNGILGMAQLLLETPLAADQLDQMQTLKGSAEALLTILDDILDLSKLEAGRVEFESLPFNLIEVFTGVTTLMQPRAAAKGLTLRTAVDPALPVWLLGDVGRLRQILLNLLGNAVKFTERGGVTLEARPDGAGGGGAGGGDPARIGILFSVTDTGIGMDQAVRDRLFEVFSQADASISRRFGGTGLGLSICKRLVEGQGGRIGVDSVPGQGSRFWFRLSYLPTRAPGRPEPRPSIAVLPPLDILMAEDNLVNQRVAKAFLAKGGHRVTVVGNGAEAVAAVRARAFDLVLMDMQMPEMDGLEASRTIRALPPPAGQVPIIALTANAMQGDAERCRGAGMNGYVSKPFSPTSLSEAIAQTLTAPDLPPDRRERLSGPPV